MAIAAGVVAQSNMTGSSASANFDVNCVKPFVEKRETALIASYDKMSACIKTAMTERKTSLLETWSKTDNKERRTTRNTEWTTYVKAKSACQKTYKSEVKATWKQFHEDTKACKVVTRGAEPEDHDSKIEE